MAGISAISWIFFLAVFVVIPIWAWSTIVKKAGFSPWLGVLSVIPLVNIVLLFVFAYSRWPIDGRPGDAA